MSFCLATLWHDRQRFLPATLAVAFSALLVALQCGLLLGTFSIVSIPVDHTAADVWVGCPDVLSVDVGGALPARWRSRLGLPEIEQTEVYYQGFRQWRKPRTGGSELAIIIGSRLEDGALGAVAALTPDLRARLTEPGAVVVDEADLGRLGIEGVGGRAEVGGQRVRVVGLVQGLKGLAGPYVFCSLETARRLLGLSPDQATYLLARCQPGADAAAVVARLRDYRDMSVFTSAEFSRRSRCHWLFKTGAGISLGCAAVLGLLVGAVITSQTLYAATAASLREYAVLRAMGIPRWRMTATVLIQAFWVGVAGIFLSWPVVFGLAQVAAVLGAKSLLPVWLLASAGAVTLAMALLSGLAALRSLRLVEPAVLLR
jgi:putative ABC transport system permease protein